LTVDLIIDNHTTYNFQTTYPAISIPKYQDNFSNHIKLSTRIFNVFIKNCEIRSTKLKKYLKNPSYQKISLYYKSPVSSRITKQLLEEPEAFFTSFILIYLHISHWLSILYLYNFYIISQLFVVFLNSLMILTVAFEPFTFFNFFFTRDAKVGTFYLWLSF